MAKCACLAVMKVISRRRRHLAGHCIQMKPDIVSFSVPEKREKGRDGNTWLIVG